MQKWASGTRGTGAAGGPGTHVQCRTRHPPEAGGLFRGFCFLGFFWPKFGFVVNKLNFHSLHIHHLFWELVKKKEETPSEGAGDEGTRERD